MSHNELKHWTAFLQIPDIGHKTIGKLLRCFKTLENAWRAPASNYRKLKFSDCFIDKLNERRPKINPDAELETMLKHNIQLVTFSDKQFPPLLKQISAPPAAIFYKGDLTKCNQQVAIAIVGTRRLTSYGERALKQIVPTLVANNFSIISGLALGADAFAHSLCLKNNGHTIAVLGGGLSSIYPRQNAKLAEQILSAGGAIFSEYAPKMPALREHFPARNRIISGLSNATLVIEAGQKSGALITAFFATEQNREVFAIPGNIDCPFSQGTNGLIKQGAYLTTSAQDILDILKLSNKLPSTQRSTPLNLTKEQVQILTALTHGFMHINQLSKSTNLPISTINANLIIMEMNKLIKNRGNMEYEIF
ncbi:DNA-protecting protein DprA [Candidatus Falkowbacteria bacterium]|nr:DNA-protecting protein DprA [Candidatus Falkowbacteria bacterium]